MQSVHLIASPSCKFHDYPVMRSQIRSVKTGTKGDRINQALAIKVGENVNIRDANTEHSGVSDGTRRPFLVVCEVRFSLSKRLETAALYAVTFLVFSNTGHSCDDPNLNFMVS